MVSSKAQSSATTILVLYASKRSSTAEIAETIAATLRREDLGVCLERTEDVQSLEPYDAAADPAAAALLGLPSHFYACDPPDFALRLPHRSVRSAPYSSSRWGRKVMFKLLMGLGIVAFSALALGCGGSENAATSVRATVETPPTKAQFIRGAEEVCAKMVKKQEAALASWSKDFAGNPKEVQEHFKEAYGEVVVPFMRELANDLEGLGAPKDGEAAVTAMTRGLRKASQALENKGPDGISHYTLYAFKRAAFAYGLKTCPAL
jgi:hypothetical protein